MDIWSFVRKDDNDKKFLLINLVLAWGQVFR